MIDFVKDFGSLINLAALLTLTAYLMRVNRTIVASKQAEIDLLQQRLDLSEEFSVKNVLERFRQLRIYYEEEVTAWYEKSIEALRQQHAEALRENDARFAEQLSEEMSLRGELATRLQDAQGRSDHSGSGSPGLLLAGDYAVVGQNPGWQRAPENRYYFGSLRIQQEEETYSAVWMIRYGDIKHEFTGNGVLLGKNLSVGFGIRPKSSPRLWRGVVSYEILDKELLRGVWASEDGTQTGWEELRKVEGDAVPSRHD